MNVNQIIEQALKDVTEHIWPMCCPDDSPTDKYIVYNPELEKAALYADDVDEAWIQYVQIHLFTKGNYLADRKTIRKALRNAGFTLTGIDAFYEKGSGYNHLCFECYIEEEGT